jgi:tRNA modification GTPase
MFSYSDEDTIVALSTPLGKGAIAVVRLSGSQALTILNQIFSSPLTEDHRRQAVTGTIHRGNDQRIIDQCVVTYFQSPRSYTGEDVIEISCHCNPIIIEQIIQLVVGRGARVAQPGEFTKRAFLNHKLDLSQAEAVAAVIAAKTRAGLACSLRQLDGSFSQLISELKQETLHLASLIEVNLDFNEEDLQVYEKPAVLRRVQTATDKIDKLLHTYNYGRLLKEGVKLLLLGKPNVGKSSLLNALVEKERAIVSEVPGTTRDYIEEYTQIEGFPIQIVDTAGIRETLDLIEEVGVKKALKHIESSDLILAIFEIHQPLNEDDLQLIEYLNQYVQKNVPFLVVLNKLDLGADQRTIDLLTELNNPLVKVSAITGQNMEILKQQIKNSLLVDSGMEDESLVVTNARHKQALDSARQALKSFQVGLQSGVDEVVLASELRSALDYLGEISGEVSSEDLLHHIFSQFCVGK